MKTIPWVLTQLMRGADPLLVTEDQYLQSEISQEKCYCCDKAGGLKLQRGFVWRDTEKVPVFAFVCSCGGGYYLPDPNAIKETQCTLSLESEPSTQPVTGSSKSEKSSTDRSSQA